MKFAGFIGTSSPSRSSSWLSSRAANLYPEVDESGGAAKDPKAVIGTPGIHVFMTLPKSPLRCLWAGHGRLFAVAGDTYYEVHSNGAYDIRANVGDDGKRAQIFANGTQVMIISAGNVFIDDGNQTRVPHFGVGGTAYTDLTIPGANQLSSAAHPFTNLDVNTFITLDRVTGGWINGRFLISSVTGGIAQLLSSPGTIGSTAGTGAQDFGAVTGDMGGYIDGYFIVKKPNSQTVYFSQPLDGLSWDINDFFTKSGAPDRLTALIVDHEEVWLFGYETNEVWRDTGNGIGGLPFEKDPGAVQHRGIAAPWSADSLADGVAWLGEDIRGRGVAYRAQGYQPVRISTHAVETAWSLYSTIADAEAFVYSEGGHEFWLINFPTANTSWAYDATASAQLGSPQWHERAYYHSGSSLSGVVNVSDRTVTWVSGDKFTPQIYTITINAVTYGASPGYTAGVIDNTKLILSSDAGTQNGKAYTATTLDRVRQRVHAFAFYKHMVGDYSTGVIYEQNLDFFDDNGVDMVRRRSANPLSDEETTYFGQRFQLEMETGDGTVNPVLDWSDDRGKSFGVAHTGAAGVQDQYSFRVLWRRLGKWRHRTWRITIQGQTKVVMTAADLDIEKGTF